MNWRYTAVNKSGQHMDRYYDHPNTQLFPGADPAVGGFVQWLDWLKTNKLRTYVAIYIRSS